MDQDAFRQLLASGKSTTSTQPQPRSRGSLFGSKPKAEKPTKPTEPAFKPRKLSKPAESKYRDRASERRHGEGNDFAHVEAVLQEFEKQTANEDDKEVIEEKRRYLGGDKDHTVLVKGLDFALLEQNKAKAVLTKDDVDALEEAFQEGHSKSEPSAESNGRAAKKRTREDILRELKDSRAKGALGGASTLATATKESVDPLQEAKKQGKFKPIGFKPIGSALEGKKKAKGEGAERKKKKRKVEATTPAPDSERTPAEEGNATTQNMPDSSSSMAKKPVPDPEPDVEPLDPDFDIFGGVEEYKGMDSGDEDDEGNDAEHQASRAEDDGSHSSTTPNLPPRRWVDIDEPEQRRPVLPIPIPQAESSDASGSRPPGRSQVRVESEDEDMDDQPMRLQPLASSALPSIKDLLAMDDAAGSKKKKKKGKAKKKGKGDDDDDD